MFSSFLFLFLSLFKVAITNTNELGGVVVFVVFVLLLLFCVAALSNIRLSLSKQNLHEHILRVKDADKVPFVLIGNKCDLEEDREIPTDKGTQLAAELGCKFLEASAKTKHNVVEAFEAIVHEINAFRQTAASATNSVTPVKVKRRRRCVLI